MKVFLQVPTTFPPDVEPGVIPPPHKLIDPHFCGVDRMRRDKKGGLIQGEETCPEIGIIKEKIDLIYCDLLWLLLEPILENTPIFHIRIPSDLRSHLPLRPGGIPCPLVAVWEQFLADHSPYRMQQLLQVLRGPETPLRP